MPLTKLSLYQVEFTRLDEQQTISYLVAVDPGQTEVQAIAKAEAEFLEYAAQNGDLVLMPLKDVQSIDKRRAANALKTYWRNRCAEAGIAHH